MQLQTEKNTFDIEIDDAIVTVSKKSNAYLSDLRKRHTKMKRGVAIPDQGAITCSLFCATIVGWQGVTDEHGEDLPCTKANKKLVYKWNSEFVADVLEGAEAGLIDIAEDEEKN